MMKIVLLLLVCLTGALATLTANCRRCICEVEGCELAEGQCNWDVNSDSCGPYQIKEPYWIDCGEPGPNWRDCTMWFPCSETCMDAYFARYGTYCTGGPTPTCQDYARIHNGGPFGCRNDNTLGYWDKVSNCCNSVGGCD